MMDQQRPKSMNFGIKKRNPLKECMHSCGRRINDHRLYLHWW